MAQSQWKNTCCNPFQKINHSSKRKSLRPVTKWMCRKVPSIIEGSKICDDCRKKIVKFVPELSDSASDTEFESTSPACSDEKPYTDPSISVSLLNQYLHDVGDTPITKRRMKSKKYSKQKVERMVRSMERMMISDTKDDISTDGEIIEQLKQKFHSTVKRSEKVQILTILPCSWSIRKIQAEFGVSNYMARKAKELVAEKGVLSTPNPKPGHSLPSETVDLITNFYESDDVSRIMPGKKDFVSVKSSDGRVHIQKRLVLCNLKEVHQLFKDTHPSVGVGFSKFAELRPKYCVLAGESGTHSICVCTIHQNVKLMMLGVKLPEVTAHDDVPLKTYHHCLAKMICNPPQPDCYLNKCKYCPGVTELKETLLTALDMNMIDNVVFKQWTAVDRSRLETFSMPSDEFVELLCDKLKLLSPHSFIASQQSSFYKDCKSALQPGELVVTADFSENYAFVLQDAAQGFHWNNLQATIHPFVCYYSESWKACHLSFVVISDCLHHDTVAVNLFQKKLIAHLKQKLIVNKIIYFSDGAAPQYKNRKNLINLCYHESDFGVQAEWHFSATSHGKGACDGVGGTVKRLAARASLQRPYEEQIMTPYQLFEWASSNVPGITFCYCSTEEYEEQKVHVEERFLKTRTIPGTRKHHSFMPLSKETIMVKEYSKAIAFNVEKISRGDSEIPIEQVSGFVTCAYQQKWWVACVLQVDKENAETQLTLLQSSGASRSFKYPKVPIILTIPITKILTKVNPRTTTGRVYTLTQKEIKIASDIFRAISGNN